jgi:hypothetical protein
MNEIGTILETMEYTAAKQAEGKRADLGTKWLPD